MEVSEPSRVATYKGYTVSDLTCKTRANGWRARVGIMGIMVSDPTRTPSQRFLDFETFERRDQAMARAEAGAVAWIDHEVRSNPLARQSGFAPLL